MNKNDKNQGGHTEQQPPSPPKYTLKDFQRAGLRGVLRGLKLEVSDSEFSTMVNPPKRDEQRTVTTTVIIPLGKPSKSSQHGSEEK